LRYLCPLSRQSRLEKNLRDTVHGRTKRKYHGGTGLERENAAMGEGRSADGHTAEDYLVYMYRSKTLVFGHDFVGLQFRECAASTREPEASVVKDAKRKRAERTAPLALPAAETRPVAAESPTSVQQQVPLEMRKTPSRSWMVSRADRDVLERVSEASLFRGSRDGRWLMSFDTEEFSLNRTRSLTSTCTVSASMSDDEYEVDDEFMSDM